MEKIVQNSPRLSIITVNLNESKHLRDTIISVINQEFTDYEFIIIDGGSEDESVEIIKEHSDKIHHWTSEPDNGIYHAMNKGIIKSSGEYCYFLNSGDVLNSEKVLKKIMENDLMGDIIAFQVKVDTGSKGIELVIPPKEVSFYHFYIHTIIHQAIFIRRSLFQKCGLYNEEKKITADWEFFVKVLFLSNCSYQMIPLVIAIFKSEGISSLQENHSISLKEREDLLLKDFSKFIPDYKLIQKRSTYEFLKNVQKYSQLRIIFYFVSKIINKILKIFAL
jgi:glycosyltransferase involved in cell wall biosynthesis